MRMLISTILHGMQLAQSSLKHEMALAESVSGNVRRQQQFFIDESKKAMELQLHLEENNSMLDRRLRVLQSSNDLASRDILVIKENLRHATRHFSVGLQALVPGESVAIQSDLPEQLRMKYPPLYSSTGVADPYLGFDAASRIWAREFQSTPNSKFLIGSNVAPAVLNAGAIGSWRKKAGMWIGYSEVPTWQQHIRRHARVHELVVMARNPTQLSSELLGVFALLERLYARFLRLPDRDCSSDLRQQVKLILSSFKRHAPVVEEALYHAKALSVPIVEKLLRYLDECRIAVKELTGVLQTVKPANPALSRTLEQEFITWLEDPALQTPMLGKCNIDMLQYFDLPVVESSQAVEEKISASEQEQPTECCLRELSEENLSLRVRVLTLEQKLEEKSKLSQISALETANLRETLEQTRAEHAAVEKTDVEISQFLHMSSKNDVETSSEKTLAALRLLYTKHEESVAEGAARLCDLKRHYDTLLEKIVVKAREVLNEEYSEEQDAPALVATLVAEHQKLKQQLEEQSQVQTKRDMDRDAKILPPTPRFRVLSSMDDNDTVHEGISIELPRRGSLVSPTEQLAPVEGSRQRALSCAREGGPTSAIPVTNEERYHTRSSFCGTLAERRKSTPQPARRLSVVSPTDQDTGGSLSLRRRVLSKGEGDYMASSVKNTENSVNHK